MLDFFRDWFISTPGGHMIIGLLAVVGIWTTAVSPRNWWISLIIVITSPLTVIFGGGAIYLIQKLVIG